MTSIERREAAAALDDIEQIVRRVRQSRIYNLASLMLIMWGALVFAGNIAAYLWPRYAGYIWIAVNMTGILGSFAIGALGPARTGIRAFDIRMLAALLLFFAFGYLCTCVIGQFTPRRVGRELLTAGQVGYLICNIKSLGNVHIGDTVTRADGEPLKAKFEMLLLKRRESRVSCHRAFHFTEHVDD